MFPTVAGYPIGHVAYCASMHFALAFLAALLGYWLTWTICSRVWPGRRTYLSPWCAALLCAALSHWIEDSTVNWF